MQAFTKTHANKKAAENHMKKIIARGGKASMQIVGGEFLINYYFPETKEEQKSKKKRYDVLSPDEITIRMPGVPLFTSRKQMMDYFKKWKDRYKIQGYYSSAKFGRIHLLDLEDFCQFIKI